jgi:hypothetical protein
LIGNIKLWYIEVVNKIAFHNLILTKYFPKVKIKGSSFVSPALGGAGQGRLNINNNLPPKKIRAKLKRTGKNSFPQTPFLFARSLSAPKARQGRETARLCVSKETKSAKIVSLFEKIFCGCHLKNVSIFAGFVRRQAASR